MIKSPGIENPSFKIPVFCGNVRSESPDGKREFVDDTSFPTGTINKSPPFALMIANNTYETLSLCLVSLSLILGPMICTTITRIRIIPLIASLMRESILRATMILSMIV